MCEQSKKTKESAHFTAENIPICVAYAEQLQSIGRAWDILRMRTGSQMPKTQVFSFPSCEHSMSKVQQQNQLQEEGRKG